MEETSMIRVLKIEPGRPPEEVKMANTLEALQEAVGGLIEVVTLDSDVCLICNDEGKLIAYKWRKSAILETPEENFFPR